MIDDPKSVSAGLAGPRRRGNILTSLAAAEKAPVFPRREPESKDQTPGVPVTVTEEPYPREVLRRRSADQPLVGNGADSGSAAPTSLPTVSPSQTVEGTATPVLAHPPPACQHAVARLISATLAQEPFRTLLKLEPAVAPPEFL